MLAEQRKVNTEQRHIDRYEVWIQAGVVILTAVMAGVALIWAVVNARSGSMTVGDVSIVIAAVAGIQGALRTVVQSIADGHEALLLFDHYAKVLADAGDLPTPAAPVAVRPLRHEIEIDDVWFRYAEDHPWVLRGVSLTIPAGLSCALVGLNGSGKSTLVKLLCRFYDRQHGAIRWDGVDLRDMAPAEMRRRLGVLFQDFMQYDLIVRENIAFGAEIPDRSVEAAARRAGVHGTIARLPMKYATMLSRTFLIGAKRNEADTGVILSGGQWQRLALARTLMKADADLVILDEPSAGLDAQAEHEVHESLRKYRTGRTSVLISHRLSTVRDCELIVVLSGGQVTEIGTHADLIAREGEYEQLFQTQARGYQASPGGNIPTSRTTITPSTLSRDTGP